jgi:hypothetical protein
MRRDISTWNLQRAARTACEQDFPSGVSVIVFDGRIEARFDAVAAVLFQVVTIHDLPHAHQVSQRKSWSINGL